MTNGEKDPDWAFAVKTLDNAVRYRILDKVGGGSHLKLNKAFHDYYLQAAWDKSQPSVLDAEGEELPLQEGLQVIIGHYLFENGFHATEKEIFTLSYNIAILHETELADPKKTKKE